MIKEYYPLVSSVMKKEKVGESDFVCINWQNASDERKKELTIQLNEIRCKIFGKGSIVMETPREFLKLIDEYLPPVKNTRAINIGCGSGGFEKILMDHGYKVYGVDISPLQAHRARVSFISEDQQNFIAGDITHLPFRKGNFDFAAALFVLEHVPDVFASLQEIARVLRPEGTVIIGVPISRQLESGISIITGHVNAFKLPEQISNQNQENDFLCLDNELPNFCFKIEEKLLFHSTEFVRKSFRYAKSIEETTQALYICSKV